MVKPMKDESSPSMENVRQDRLSIVKRLAQYAGAFIVTGFVLWFLFGIPAYILFDKFLR